MSNHLSIRPLSLSIAFILFAMVAAIGQESFNVTINKNPIRNGETLQLSLSLRNLRRDVSAPQIKGLKLLGGPSTSQNNSWVNGVSSSEIRYTYTYQVQSNQDINIPSFTVAGSTGKLKSNAFKVKVLPRSAKQQKQRGLGEVACVIELSKRNVFIGEPLVASFKIYNRANNLDVREYNVPEMAGFWTEQIEMPDARWEPEVIDGRRYNVATVRKVLLFPQKTGDITIEGFNLIGYKRTSFFDGKNVSVASNPVKIQVDPLPEPIPNRMLGVFSRFRVQTKEKVTTCETNEALTVDYVYSGDGHLKFIQEPDLKWPGEFEVYDPEIIDRIKVTNTGESGSRTFRYVVIPRAPGEYILPSVEGQWFNTRTKAYIDVTRTEKSITVERGNGSGTSGLAYNSKTDIQVLNQDIRFIGTDWNGSGLARNRWQSSFPLSTGWIVVGPSLLALVFIGKRRKEEEDRNPSKTRQRKAKTTVRNELRAAKKHIDDPDLFFPALGNGIEQYLLAKLAWSASQYQREAILEAIEHRAPSTADQWKKLLDQLDMARYAPGALPAPREMITLSENLVNQTEKSWTNS
ncbi:MAG: hypothetical protein CL834_05065 [Crocinitomicaceae bacterium]|nr:hypothetical protein [Crocinitomicaceae bacterium]